MKFDSHGFHRHTIRLRGYDYSRPGAYFVTVVTQGRECLFGDCRGVVSTPPDAARVGDETSPRRRPTLGQVVAYFKYQSTKRINQVRDSPGILVWQRNYYEHILRSPAEYDRIRCYMENNPIHWTDDEDHPAANK